ncbi:uncharacterized protein K444DRAFT_20191 [Hyaloscypha bicolor E]|uniref:Uncharacterized protein n=1 Tax=Hyaloscypha bicolor E TaxID=1095630 RepID=A0A2J6T4W9_9HELO|nr:uncharacterized protein K444DRAFT_20191 [Hyaloscypha bicolor E]PMD58069.1 hypothetical protein K444DRAFT_20191 [Hyaloscypha bicolor E]
MISAFVSKEVEQATTTLPQNNESKSSDTDDSTSTPTNQPEEQEPCLTILHNTSSLASDSKKAVPFFDTYIHDPDSGTTSGIPLSQATASEKNSKQKKRDFWKVFTSLMPEEHTAVKLALRKRRPGYSRTLSSLQVLDHSGGSSSMKWLRIALKVLSLGILDHKETGDDSQEVERALLIIVLNTPLDGSQPLPTEPQDLDFYDDSDSSAELSPPLGRRVREGRKSTHGNGRTRRWRAGPVERRERSQIRIARERAVEMVIADKRGETRPPPPPPPPPPRETWGSDEVVVIEEHSPPRRLKSKRVREERHESGYRTVDPAAYGGVVGGRMSSKREDRPLRSTKLGEASNAVPGESSRVEGAGRDDAGAEGENKDNLEQRKLDAVDSQSEKQEDTSMHLELEDSEEESGMDQEPASKVIEGLFGGWKPGQGTRINTSA